MRGSYRFFTALIGQVAPIVVGVLLTNGTEAAPTASTARARGSDAVPVAVSRGGARLVRFRGAVSRFVVAEPAIATATQVDGRSVQISGKAYGETVVFVWDNETSPTRLVVSVGVPTEGLTARLKAIFPNEEIACAAMADTVVLTGTVSDPIVSERAAKLAEAYIDRLAAKPGAETSGKSDRSRVLNFLNVEGRQQVQLRVKVAEVTRSAMRQMGVNMWARPSGSAGGLLAPSTPLTSNPTAPAESGFNASSIRDETTQLVQSAPIPQIFAPRALRDGFGLHFSLKPTENLALSLAISLLQEKGLAKLLSEPTLVAYSGQAADFHAGGEIPIIVPQGFGQSSVRFKNYGVQLGFTPTVLGERTIHLRMSVTVSELDRENGQPISGGTVPALRTRFSETVVRMRNGQSFAVAGLLQDRLDSRSARVPLLGDIPILGALFRESSFSRQETELVILTTANLVRPLKPGEVPPLPGEDEVSDPGSMAFFLMGSVDPELKGEPRARPAGPLGYSK